MGSSLDLKYGSLDGDQAIPRQGWPLSSIMKDDDLTSRKDGSPSSALPLTTTLSTSMEKDAPMSETDSQAAAASVAGGIDLDATFGIPLEDEPIWVGLYKSIQDVFFPPHLPPLEL